MKSATFSRIYIQLIFAVKGRSNLISQIWEDELFKYITGIVQNKNQKLLAINGMPDHIHILLNTTPSSCISDLVREIKKSSNKFVNSKNFSPFHFEWQDGFGAFSYGYSELDKVISYVQNQKEHHQTIPFRLEYEEFLNSFNIEYQPQFLFEWYD